VRPRPDPATVGQLTRISAHGTRSTADVNMPSGLELQRGWLYASAWSVAAFYSLPARGEVERIPNGAFTTTKP
jgi:hypothetical protein